MVLAVGMVHNVRLSFIWNVVWTQGSLPLPSQIDVNIYTKWKHRLHVRHRMRLNGRMMNCRYERCREDEEQMWLTLIEK